MAEFQRLHKGKVWELKYDNRTETYYTMYPVPSARKGQRGTKRKWLGRDKQKAEIAFSLFWDRLEGRETVFHTLGGKEEMINARTGKPVIVRGEPARFKVEVAEEFYFSWLRDKILSKEFQSLADGTGFPNLIRLPEILDHLGNLSLDTLWANYVDSAQYRKAIDPDEKRQTEANWNDFCRIAGKSDVEHLTLADVKRYESYLHSRGLSDRTIHNYKSQVTKVVRKNLEYYEDETHLRRVLGYFRKWERLEKNPMSSINAQAVSSADFNTLLAAANTELQAVLLLALNSAAYIREIARFKISEIDFENGTLITQRAKTGKCQKIVYLWGRTIEALKEHLRNRKDNLDYIFRAGHGGPYTHGQGLRDKLTTLRKETGLTRVEPQHLRDTFQTIAREQGVAEYHINLVMGHSTGGMGERYTDRRLHNELREACLKVERAFFPTP